MAVAGGTGTSVTLPSGICCWTKIGGLLDRLGQAADRPRRSDRRPGDRRQALADSIRLDRRGGNRHGDFRRRLLRERRRAEAVEIGAADEADAHAGEAPDP